MRAHQGPAAILIGPEGGFDSEGARGDPRAPSAIGIGLGPRILRADTAAAAAMYRSGWRRRATGVDSACGILAPARVKARFMSTKTASTAKGAIIEAPSMRSSSMRWAIITPLLRRSGGYPRTLGRAGAIWLGAGVGGRQRDRADRCGRLDQPRSPPASSSCQARRSTICTRPVRDRPSPDAGEGRGRQAGLGFLGLGMWPDKTRAELPIMPKGRYAIMLRHMPRVSSLGLDMMLRTCTIQFRVGAGAATTGHRAVRQFAFYRGKPNGKLSFRSHIWSDTDPTHRHAALRVRGWFRLWALCRLCARCADVLKSTAMANISTRQGLSFPRLPEGRAFGPAG
ncbi:gshA [Acanthosepion pharaonis]|uniref:glutamate--cysteine ligase n=1 Tax=Acanthosepion pharaonis TaxID=158019 RepID=A0A812DGW8_ACAPH|nr:gshA [Sepia pharaonis]